MLILSRKLNERIIINGNITVAVVEIRGDKVRLGIEAPLAVSVHRQEVYEAIQQEARNGLGRLPAKGKPIFQLVGEYCNALGRHGPDSEQARAVLEANVGNAEFLECAGALNRIKRGLDRESNGDAKGGGA